MTVQKLIDQLQQVENKEKEVTIIAESVYCKLGSVDDHADELYLYD